METLNEEVLQKIKELKAQLLPSWVDIVAHEMGKSPEAVYRYARGENVKHRKYHLDVLRILTRLVEEKNQEIREMLNKSSHEKDE